MENDTENFNKRDQHQQGQGSEGSQVREVAPGAAIVRDNTPRPFMYSTMTAIPPSRLPNEPAEKRESGTFSTISAFPTKPPSAPPLPEEQDHAENVYTFAPASIAPSVPPSTQQDFAWIFEYGLEMDAALLNTPERLDGLALLYGSAVLKGYRLLLKSDATERTMITLVPDARPNAEVWGVLYRVPRSVTQSHGNEPTLLEMVHVPVQSGVQAMHVVVHETYRNRALPCITYGYRDVTFAQQGSQAQGEYTDLALRRLVAIATKQKLPESYIQQIVSMAAPSPVPNTPLAATVTTEQRQAGATVAALTRAEQHTEPLLLPLVSRAQEKHVPVKQRGHYRFVAFAVYLCCLLLVILGFAIIQGVAGDMLNDHFMVLGVPWLVLIYGLLGGCVSSIVVLGRTRQPEAVPVYVVVVWYTRPFIGAVLALFAYLLLNSGLFFATGGGRTVFLLVGALAGMCEGWLFGRK